jgi:hypothetical protein
MADGNVTPDRADTWIAEIANRIRPALNIYSDGTVRVSHGQDDIAETIVWLVLKALFE